MKPQNKLKCYIPFNKIKVDAGLCECINKFNNAKFTHQIKCDTSVEILIPKEIFKSKKQ